MKTVQHTIGIMDPHGLSFRYSLERLLAHYNPRFDYQGRIHTVSTGREGNDPYDTLAADLHFDAVVNRGDQWHPHHTSFSVLLSPQVYLLNDMISFQAINKNTAYGHMHDLGLHIPPTYALPSPQNLEEPPDDATIEGFYEPRVRVDLRRIAARIGFPAYIKPQSGGGWRGVSRVENLRQLAEAYAQADQPMNLQAAVDFREFVRTVGIGPQMMPMHYDPTAQYSHDRYLRNPVQAVDFQFLTAAEHDELTKIAKVINAFYGWDHNSCEALIGRSDNVVYPIDFANVSPDSKVISLHFHFPQVVKAMIRWLCFVTVTGRRKPLAFNHHWHRFFAIRDEARARGWSYLQTLDRYAALADEHFQTEQFHEFVDKHMQDFEEKAYEWFAGEEFDRILQAEVNRVFQIPHERPAKLAHYRGIHGFWLHCEAQRGFWR